MYRGYPIVLGPITTVERERERGRERERERGREREREREERDLHIQSVTIISLWTITLAVSID